MSILSGFAPAVFLNTGPGFASKQRNFALSATTFVKTAIKCQTHITHTSVCTEKLKHPMKKKEEKNTFSTRGGLQFSTIFIEQQLPQMKGHN